jgi:hypothetical protein
MCRIESHQLLTGNFKSGFEAKVFKRYFSHFLPKELVLIDSVLYKTFSLINWQLVKIWAR